MNRLIPFLLAALLAIVLASSTLFIVDQRQFAVVYSLGEIKQVITEPGLKFRLPIVQNVVMMDRRVQTLESREPRAIFTAEKKSVVVDWLVKWRITDARTFIRNNGTTMANLETRLAPLVQAALNEEVTKRTVQGVLSSERDAVMRGVGKRLSDDVKQFGVEIVDVRVKRVDFSREITGAVYRRMESERKRAANELRSTGAAEAAKIKADADRQREIIVYEAYKEAQAIKGEGDAKAAAIYAEAFGRDPQFAQFYRQLQAYRETFRSKNDVMVMDPNSEFFKAMRNGGPVAAAPARK